jgi:MFS family permease
VGAFLGPALAMGLMLLSADNFTAVFWVAVVPGFMAFALVVLAVHEPERPPALRQVKAPLSLAELHGLGGVYWRVVAIATVFTLARFSEAFLILQARSVGLPIALTPLVLVVMNVVYALAAYPAGVLSDRIDRMTVFVIGLGFLIIADVVLALSAGLLGVTAGVVLWGLHMGFTQGVMASLVADTAPPELRGTAFGMFNLLGGLALLAASVIAGALWDGAGPAATFLAGAALTALALIGLLLLRPAAAGAGRTAPADIGDD